MKICLIVAKELLGRNTSRLLISLFLGATLAAFAGCSSGPGDEGVFGAPTPPPATPNPPTITLALTDAAGATVSSISSDAPATVSATLKDAAGAVVPSAVVTFGTDEALATIVPAATALTNASGVATVTLKPASNLAVGATTITADAEVGTVAVTGAISFAIETTATPGEPTLTLTLTNAAGATISTISTGAPATVKATLKDAAGAVVPNAVVTFSTDATLAIITPAATALTDASGVATVTLQASGILAAGAATVSATVQLGTTAVTGSIGFAVGSAAVTVTAPVLGVGAAPLSAFGTTSITVAVSIGGVSIADGEHVTFSSPCGNAGKAVLSGADTAGGLAQGSYKDNGCAGTDLITASIAGVTSPSTTLVISTPATGSIQFVSATPSSISLKGTGGVEAAQVRFRVLDTGGKPLSGKTVTFGLSTTVGGITLTPPTPDTATSDADGLVVTTVNSGTVSTPVRVTASTPGAIPGVTLTTQSSALTITTGIPDQDSFTMGATKLNVEDIHGNTTVLVARLADHFNNPVPDGTIVNFTTEGGSIVGSCSTVTDDSGNSNCSATLTVQEPRLAFDGRYSVMAYAVGEESFTDLNGNGVADVAPNELLDQNGASTDLPEAFRDDNENGVRDANEPFFDFNQNGVYDGPDGKYSGVLCDIAKSSAGTCSADRHIHARKSIVIIFSGSAAVISMISPSSSSIDLQKGLPGRCNGQTTDVDLRIVDARGNPMPVGTKIDITADGNGKIVGPSSFVQANTNVTPPADLGFSPPVAGTWNYEVSVKDDGVKETQTDPITGLITIGPCIDPTDTGVLTVTVTTPGVGTVGPTTTVAHFTLVN